MQYESDSKELIYKRIDKTEQTQQRVKRRYISCCISISRTPSYTDGSMRTARVIFWIPHSPDTDSVVSYPTASLNELRLSACTIIAF